MAESDPRIKMRFQFVKGDELKYISHLDTMRLLLRGLRRGAFPLVFSQGYHPHPLLGLSPPLPLGVTSEAGYGRDLLREAVPPGEFMRRLNGCLPGGLQLVRAAEADLSEPPLMAVINAALYRAFPEGEEGREALEEGIRRLLERKEIPVIRKRQGKKPSRVDLRPHIFAIRVAGEEEPCLELLLRTGSSGGASPGEILRELPGKEGADGQLPWRLHRAGLYIYRDGFLREPM